MLDAHLTIVPLSIDALVAQLYQTFGSLEMQPLDWHAERDSASASQQI